jgi:hypothetical protein
MAAVAETALEKRGKSKSVQELRTMKRHFRAASFSKRLPQTWPSPEESAGEVKGPLKKSRFFYWEAIGPAREAFNELAPEIGKLLEERQRPVPGSDFVGFTIYMFGEAPSTATPQIMFMSKHKPSRKESVGLLKASKLLDRFPGIGVGHWPAPPHVGPQEPATGPAQHHSHAAPHLPSRIEAVSPTNGSHAILIRFHFDQGSTSSTVAAALILSGETHLVIAAHALCPPTSPHDSLMYDSVSSDAESDDVDLGPYQENDLDIFTDDIEDTISTGFDSLRDQRSWSDGDESSSGSSDSNTSNAAWPTVDLMAVQGLSGDRLPSSREPLTWSPTPQPHSDRPSTTSCSTLPMLCFDLDYGVIAADVSGNIDLQSMPILTSDTAKELPMGPGSTRPVLAHTARRGPINGWLKREGIFVRLRRSLSYQEVYLVTLNLPILSGDCGAVVVDETTGDMYGHVITRGTNTHTGFVVPSKLVVDDISRHFDAAAPNSVAGVDGPTVKSDIPQSPCKAQDAGKISISLLEQQLIWREAIGSWDEWDDETCSSHPDRSQATPRLFDSPRTLATSVSDSDAPQDFPPPGLDQTTALYTLRSHLALTLARITNCDLEIAKMAIQVTSDIAVSDLSVAMPRLRLKSIAGQDEEEDWEERTSEIMRKVSCHKNRAQLGQLCS